MAATRCGGILRWRNQRHATLRAAPGFRDAYLGVHGARVGSSGCRRRHPVRAVPGHHACVSDAGVISRQPTGRSESGRRRRRRRLCGGGTRRMSRGERGQRTGSAAGEDCRGSTIERKRKAFERHLDLQRVRGCRRSRGRARSGGWRGGKCRPRLLHAGVEIRSTGRTSGAVAPVLAGRGLRRAHATGRDAPLPGLAQCAVAAGWQEAAKAPATEERCLYQLLRAARGCNGCRILTRRDGGHHDLDDSNQRNRYPGCSGRAWRSTTNAGQRRGKDTRNSRAACPPRSSQQQSCVLQIPRTTARAEPYRRVNIRPSLHSLSLAPPADVPGFIVAQLSGVAAAVFSWLLTNSPSAETIVHLEAARRDGRLQISGRTSQV